MKISTFVANQNHNQKTQNTPSQTVQSTTSTSHHQNNPVKTTHTTSLPTTTETTLTVNLTRSHNQSTVFSQGNTYILASSVQGWFSCSYSSFNIISQFLLTF